MLNRRIRWIIQNFPNRLVIQIQIVLFYYEVLPTFRNNVKVGNLLHQTTMPMSSLDAYIIGKKVAQCGGSIY